MVIVLAVVVVASLVYIGSSISDVEYDYELTDRTSGTYNTALEFDIITANVYLDSLNVGDISYKLCIDGIFVDPTYSPNVPPIIAKGYSFTGSYTYIVPNEYADKQYSIQPFSYYWTDFSISYNDRLLA